MYKFTFRHYNIKLLKNFEYFVEACCGPVVKFSRQLQMSTYVTFVVITIRSFPHSWVTTCVCNKSSTTSVTKEVETGYLFVAVYRGVRFAQSVIYVL
jgi:hypothetical protein